MYVVNHNLKSYFLSIPLPYTLLAVGLSHKIPPKSPHEQESSWLWFDKILESSVFRNTSARHCISAFLITGSGACVSFIWQFQWHLVVSPSGGGHNYTRPFPVSHQPYPGPLLRQILHPVAKILVFVLLAIYAQLKKWHCCPVCLTGEAEGREEWSKECS